MPRDHDSTLERREFLRLSALTGVAAVTGLPSFEAPAKFEFEEATIADLQSAIRSGKETAASLTGKYLDRIRQIDQAGPNLRAVIEVNPEALKEAEQNRPGPLRGVPVLIKDNIETGDQMLTTAGSLALAHNRAVRDAFIVTRLRRAGAIILGKTNLSEWANFRSTHSTSGWSGRGGLTRNPYILDRNTSGSSSGSGAGVSAGLCAVAVGTETDGSIISPSSVNGVVGIKPTLGLVSRTGIIPISHNQDTAGPMARTVTDAAILLGVLAAPDPSDAASAGWHGEIDYTRFLKKDGLKGARIGVARALFGFLPEVDRLMDEVIRALKGAGAELVDPVEIPHLNDYGDAEDVVLKYDFKHDLNAYLASMPPSVEVRTLKDLIVFNEANRGKEMPFFGQETLIASEAKGPLTDDAYVKALESSKRLSGAEGLDAALREHRLDAIIGPSGSPAWTTDLVNGDHYVGGNTSPSAVSGNPAITVPAGLIHELPVGVTFYGAAWSEPVLLRLAYAFEQAMPARRSPKFLRTLPM